MVSHAKLLTKIIWGNVYINNSKAWVIEFSMHKELKDQLFISLHILLEQYGKVCKQ